MKICSLTAFVVPIALRRPVRHASHVRHHNDTLIVRCRLDTGHTGWGEGLPRPYVTGETIETAVQHVQQTSWHGLADSFQDPQEASDMLDEFVLADVSAPPEVVPRACFGNSVRCAVELAVLDAACQAAGCSVGEFICRLPEAAGIVRRQKEVFYSGVITSETPGRQRLSAFKMKLFGFAQLKVKVGTAGQDDRRCLRSVRRIVGKNVDLRLDANEAWQPQDVVSRMEPLLPFAPSCLEQPVPHAAVAELADIRSSLAVPVMLDESLCCQEDAEAAIRQNTCDLFNLRLSKCGGIRRSVRLAATAGQAGLGWQLGSQVGETGILSAAGRHFACNIDRIRYLEGSYDRFLVRERLTQEDLTFTRRGRAERIDRPGLGITVPDERVQNLAEQTLEML